MKHWKTVLLVLIGLAGLLFWQKEPLLAQWFAGKIEKTDLETRQALLKPSIEIRLPEHGEAPFPVVLQFHGCAGIRPAFHHQWADVANDAGYAAMIIDSNGPRGYSREQSLEIICAGKALLGQERAGDVYAAIALAEQDSRLDTEHMVLAGWSHGAWSVMDYLTMDVRKTPPPGITKNNAKISDIDGALLFYPYCGFGALSRFQKPKQNPPLLTFIAGADEIVNAKQCIKQFNRRKNQGEPIDMVIYKDANHVFDDPFLEPDWIHWYNEDYTNDASSRYAKFLSERLTD